MYDSACSNRHVSKCLNVDAADADEIFRDFLREILEGIDPGNKTKKCVIYYCEGHEKTYEYEWKKVTC